MFNHGTEYPPAAAHTDGPVDASGSSKMPTFEIHLLAAAEILAAIVLYEGL